MKEPGRFLVTAGSTREAIDRVRDWGNIFTGNTGFAIAEALARIGHVDLLTSNAAHFRQLESSSLIEGIAFRSHSDLVTALEQRMRTQSYDGIFMTAAVSDYKPVETVEIVSRENTGRDGEQCWIVRNVQAEKVKSTYANIAVAGARTEKIIDLFRSRWNFHKLLVKFKLEVGIDDEQLIEIGQRSRLASAANFLVANTLDMVSGARAGAYLLSDAGSQWVARLDLPDKLRSLAGEYL